MKKYEIEIEGGHCGDTVIKAKSLGKAVELAEEWVRDGNWSDRGQTSLTSGRSSSFYEDTSLPPNFYHVLPTGYSGSGYDRGHMRPSGDRTDTVEDNDQTFLMSNMIPQTPDNNQGIWNNLESYCRTLAQAGNEVLITCGPEGFSGARTASAGQIFIPSNTWKIIVVAPLGAGSAVTRISNDTQVIAVNIPNIAGIRSAPWQNYVTTVNHLQTNTGYAFFTALNSNVAAVLRSKLDGALPLGITGFAPTNGAPQTTVTINGANFSGVTGVNFNGVGSTYTVNSSTSIVATVPNGATTGPISVIGAGGLASSASSFTVNNPLPIPTTLAVSVQGSAVRVSWLSTATGYGLEQNVGLTTNGWSPYGGTILDDGTTKSATITNPAGTMFYRLYYSGQ